MRYPRLHEALAMAAIGVAACQLGCRAKPGSTLHPARVSVQPYASHNFDPLAEFSESSPLQVAVFLTKAEAPSLGLVHVLGEMGIPFFFTRNLDQALKHGLLLLYPAIEGDTLTKAQADQLRRYLEE